MTEKIHKIIILVLLVPLLVILLTPLDYLNLSWTLFHFWITVGYGSFILIYFAKTKGFQLFAIIATSIVVPLATFITTFLMLAGEVGAMEITPIPKTNLVIAQRYHSSILVGSLGCQFEIGYPVIGNFVIWRTNSYDKAGGGDGLYLDKFNVPPEIDYEDYEEGRTLYFLEDENLLYEDGNDNVYTITRKISNSN